MCSAQGVGSVLTASGQHELEASVMSSSGRACGAVTLLKHVANPVVLAKHVSKERAAAGSTAGPGRTWPRPVMVDQCSRACKRCLTTSCPTYGCKPASQNSQ